MIGCVSGIGILVGVIALILLTWRCCCTHVIKEPKKKDLNMKDLKTFDNGRNNERQSNGLTAVDF